MIRPSYFVSVVCGVFATVAWSIGNIISKAALSRVEPLTLLTGQLAVSAASLTALSVLFGSPHRLSDWRVGLPGILQPALAFGFSTFGLSMLPATGETMLFAVETPMVVLLAWLFLGEIPNRTIGLLCLAALVGVGLLGWSSEADPHALRGLGVALVLAGVLFASLYNVAISRISRDVDALRLTRASQLVAFVVVGLAWIVISPPAPFSLAGADVILVVTSGLLLMAVPFLLYGIALSRMSATAAALLLPLVPVFTAILASVFLREVMSARQWTGAAIVLVSALGMPFVLRDRKDGQADSTSVTVSGESI